jgi:hypothetical protein
MYFLFNRFQFFFDPVFTILVFLAFILNSNIPVLLGIIYLICYDNLIADSFPFISMSGLIIFGTSSWLRATYPLFRKPMVIIMIPVYSQFLWFMMLFGYYISESKGPEDAGYIAPFLFGNSILAFFLLVFLLILRYGDRRHDFSPELLARKIS